MTASTPPGSGADRAFGFGTRAIHAGAQPGVSDDAEHAGSWFNLQTFGNVRSRISHPTVAVPEGRIASLEGGNHIGTQGEAR